jgi:hypothetical protein
MTFESLLDEEGRGAVSCTKDEGRRVNFENT